MKLGIIGGGAIGLSLAFYARQAGHDVTVYDGGQIGGLAATLNINGEPLERYYHHFFLSDKDLIQLIKELGLEKQIEYRQAKMGFYTDEKILPFDTPLDLIKFSPLPFISRIRLGFMVLYCKLFKNWRALDGITAKEWVEAFAGKSAWEKFWKTLFYNKFTDNYDRVPAAWLWGRLNARSGSRARGKEVLCYLKGSTGNLLEQLQKRLEDDGVKIIPEHATSINHQGNVRTKKSGKKFDKVVVTVAPHIFARIAKLPKNYEKKITSIPYQGICCMVLELKKKLSDIYWLNNGEDALFGGVIEHTNLIPKKRYKANLVYLFNYVPSKHPIFKLSDKDLYQRYTADLKKIYPKFSKKDVLRYHVSRAPFANPVFYTPYLKKKPSIKTPLKNVDLLNMTMIYPQDRNISHSIKLAKEYVKNL